MSGALVSWAALGAATVAFCEARVEGSVGEPAGLVECLSLARGAS
jgi:hypothetical protein